MGIRGSRAAKRGDALTRRPPGGGDVAPPLRSLSVCWLSHSLLGEIITRHQAPGPDIHRSEKQRRGSETERERARDR